MTIKDFLPIEDYALTSMLSVDEIKKRISENIEREQRFTFVFFLLFGEKSKSQELIRNIFPFDTYVPIPYVMFLAGSLLMLIGFKVESKRSKKFLSSLLEGQETKDY